MKIEGPKPNTELFEGEKWSLPTDISLIDKAEEAFKKKIKRVYYDQTPDEILGFGLGFREALVNAIAHGNLGIEKPENSVDDIGQLAKKEQAKHPSAKKVYIEIQVDKYRISVKVRDEGKGFKPEEVPDPTIGQGLYQTKGRGLFFMRLFFDSVTYNKKGNEVTMVKEKKENI